MTNRRNFIKQSLAAAGATVIPSAAFAAAAQEDKSKPKYNLPYKNTYLKEPLVTENEYRIASPETLPVRSFAEAKKILPQPIWKGHDKEIEMY
jgi:hypothetical protein